MLDQVKNYKENQAKLPLSNSRDVNCITQHISVNQYLFATRARTQLRKV